MKKLFSNFRWSTFIAYAIVFGIISILTDWALGKFKETDFTLQKYIVGFLIRILIFGFFMALIVKPKTPNNTHS